MPSEVQQALAVAKPERTKEQSEALTKYYQTVDPERTPLSKRLAELEQQKKQMSSKITTTLVMHERDKPRETFVHVRGDFLSPGAKVEPDVPEVLPPARVRRNWTAASIADATFILNISLRQENPQPTGTPRERPA